MTQRTTSHGVLAALEGLGGLAPRLLADATGSAPSGGSWLLISRLPGIADINPGLPAAWAEQLGGTLARIHATHRGRLTGFQNVFQRPGGSVAAVTGPAAGVVTARWELLTAAPDVLTHYDFWSGNTVWEDGILTGVVDWSGGALGPRGFDVGWGRLDLCLLYGEAIAGKPGCLRERVSISLRPICCRGTCGPCPGRIKTSSPGSRTTEISGVPT